VQLPSFVVAGSMLPTLTAGARSLCGTATDCPRAKG